MHIPSLNAVKEVPTLMNASVAQRTLRSYQAALNLMDAGVYEHNVKTDRVNCSPHLRELLLLSTKDAENLDGRLWLDRVHKHDRNRLERLLIQARSGESIDVTYRLGFEEFPLRWLRHRSSVLSRDKNGYPQLLIGAVEDVTDQMDVNGFWHQLATLVPGVLFKCVLDAHRRISFPYTSQRVHEFFGATTQQVRDDPYLVFNAIHPDDLPKVLQSAESSAESLNDWHCEYRVSKGTDWQWVEGRGHPERQSDGGTVWHGLIYLIDERKSLEDRLRRLSMTDPLTGLYNRRYILRSIEEEIARYRRYGVTFSVVMLDLDHFKRVNDLYGHSVGDAVLTRLAALFKDRLRETDIAGRMGGEEFLIVLPETNEGGAALATKNLLGVFCQESFVGEGGETFHVTFSAGVACLRDSTESLQDLFNRADRATYLAKSQGRNQVCVG